MAAIINGRFQNGERARVVESEVQGEWDRGWEEHRTRQLRRLARLSMSEKLDWLEEAQQLADSITKACKKTRTDGDSSS